MSHSLPVTARLPRAAPRPGGAPRALLALALPLALWGLGCKGPVSPKPTLLVADVPFQLSLEPFQIEGLVGLHSVAYGTHDGKLVVLAGRRDGMHTFPPQRGEGAEVRAFPPDEANDTVYVVDLTARRVLGKGSVNALPARIANQLRAANVQYFTRDGRLYIVGGYAPTPDRSSMKTLDQVLAIDLAALIGRVTGNRPLDEAFAREAIAVGSHPAVAVTGGHIGLLGDRVLLAFGHLYNGLYTTGGGLAQQEYSQSVRELSFTLDGTAVNIDYIGKDPDPPPTEPQPVPDGPYHRRDYTLLPALAPDGSPRIAAYGGVFKGGRMEGYVHPIYITAASGAGSGNSAGKLSFRMTEDTTSSQLLSQYEAAAIPIYSRSRQAMYTTFFGGISQYYWDAQARALRRDPPNFNVTPVIDGLPFISSISTLRVDGKANGDFLHVEEAFPPVGGEPRCGTDAVKAPYLGANSFFVAAPGGAAKGTVIALDEITKPTVIGYVIGGIASTLPYPGPATCASNMIYAVTLVPDRATKTVKLTAPD